MHRALKKFCFSLALILAFTAVAKADEKIALSIKDHKFVPERITGSAGTKIVITLKNEDDSTEEFDSSELKREKVIGGGKELVLYVGPLQPGEYHFEGEYHADTAKGVLEIK